MMETWKMYASGRMLWKRPSSWISRAMAYIEMPEEKMVMKAKEKALTRAGLLVEAHAQELRHASGPWSRSRRAS